MFLRLLTSTGLITYLNSSEFIKAIPIETNTTEAMIFEMENIAVIPLKSKNQEYTHTKKGIVNRKPKNFFIVSLYSLKEIDIRV